MKKNNKEKAAVLLIGHGSKAPGFEKAMREVSRALTKTDEYARVGLAYLEVTKPSIPEAVNQLIESGFLKIILMPYFLLTGMHVREDIPEIVRELARKHRGKAKILLSPYLGFDDKIVELVQKRIRQAKLC